ncbi:MAG: AprI/Inh family metalloprotease inhibitor [Parvibaculaceae bacterium]|nr:AprI/Inh family metalloprotease inhibitor [Parvibaculaceae bacterium]
MKTILAMGLAFILAGVGSASANPLLQGAAMDMVKEQATNQAAGVAKEYAANKAMEIMIPDASGGPEALGSWTMLTGGPRGCVITLLPREESTKLNPIEIPEACSKGQFNVKFWELRGNILFLNDLAGMTRAKLRWDKGEDQWQGSIGRFHQSTSSRGVLLPGAPVLILAR